MSPRRWRRWVHRGRPLTALMFAPAGVQSAAAPPTPNRKCGVSADGTVERASD